MGTCACTYLHHRGQHMVDPITKFSSLRHQLSCKQEYIGDIIRSRSNLDRYFPVPSWPPRTGWGEECERPRIISACPLLPLISAMAQTLTTPWPAKGKEVTRIYCRSIRSTSRGGHGCQIEYLVWFCLTGKIHTRSWEASVFTARLDRGTRGLMGSSIMSLGVGWKGTTKSALEAIEISRRRNQRQAGRGCFGATWINLQKSRVRFLWIERKKWINLQQSWGRSLRIQRKENRDRTDVFPSDP